MAAVGWSPQDLAALMYDSLHTKLLPPGFHARLSGAWCGLAMRKTSQQGTGSTIGIQRKTNYALQPMTKEAFVRMLTADQPDTPAYFGYDATLNAKERQTLDTSLQARCNRLMHHRFHPSEERRATTRCARRGGVRGGAHRGQYQRRVERASMPDLGGNGVLICTNLSSSSPTAVKSTMPQCGSVASDSIRSPGTSNRGSAPGVPARCIEITAHIAAAELKEHLASHTPPAILDRAGTG